MLGSRRAGLQGHHDRAEVYASQLDGGVVDAGETQDAHEVPGVHRSGAVVVPVACHRPSPCPQLLVGDGVEARQEAACGSSRRGIGRHLDGSLAQCGPVGIALHHGGHHLGDAQTWATGHLGDPLVGAGVAELLVLGVEPFAAAGYAFPLLLRGTGVLHVGTSNERHGQGFLRRWSGRCSRTAVVRGKVVITLEGDS